MNKILVGLSSLLVTTGFASLGHADPLPMAGDLTLEPSVAPGSIASDAEPKSKTTAEILAVGGTLVGPAVIGVALLNDRDGTPLHGAEMPMIVTGCALAFIGPSFGNWYAHKGMSTGLALRGLGAVATTIGGSMIMSNLFSDSSTQGDVGAVIGIAGLGTFAVGTVLDLIEAPGAAGDYNRSHHVQWSVAPTVNRGAGGQQTGLAVVGTF